LIADIDISMATRLLAVRYRSSGLTDHAPSQAAHS